MRALDLTGQRFGKLTVVKRIQNGGSTKWLCHCDCGNDKMIFGTNLVNGKSASCGCVWKKHGDSHSKLHNIHNQYVLTGIVDEWKDYRVFKSWAIKNGYGDGMRICRIDTSLPHGPDNCKILPRKSESSKDTDSLQTD